MKKKLSHRKPRIVCPICLKLHCPLLEKLMGLRYTTEERRKFLTLFHNPVCPRCRHFLPSEGAECQWQDYGLVDCAIPRPCHEVQPKEKLKHHIFPAWLETTTATPESTAPELKTGSEGCQSPAT